MGIRERIETAVESACEGLASEAPLCGSEEKRLRKLREYAGKILDQKDIKRLIELAEAAEAPNLRLAVVDVGLQPVLYRQQRGVEGLLHYIEELDVYRVVKMEDK